MPSRQPLVTLAATLCFFMLGKSAEAQLVRVGPLGGVSIRAPFVSVDTLPFGGGTRVRAPLTSVNTGLYGFGGYGFRSPAIYPRIGYDVYRYRSYRYAPPIIAPVPVPVPVQPVVPVPVYPEYGYGYPDRVYVDPFEAARIDRVESLADLHRDLMRYRSARPPLDAPDAYSLDSVSETSLRLRQAAARMERSLSMRRDDADVWLDYLQPEMIVDALDGLDAVDHLDRFDLVWRNYEGVAGNSDLADIWSAPGFRQTHQGLSQYLRLHGRMLEDGGIVTSSMPSEPTRPEPTPFGDLAPYDGSRSSNAPSPPPLLAEPRPETADATRLNRFDSPLEPPNQRPGASPSTENDSEELLPPMPRPDAAERSSL